MLYNITVLQHSFQAIVGDKYGYRPIPSTISEQVFETISKYGSEENWSLVKHWYQKDVNAIPPVFLLQRISVMIPDVNNTVRLFLIVYNILIMSI